MLSHPLKLLKYKRIIKTTLNLMVLIQETNKGWDLRNKS